MNGHSIIDHFVWLFPGLLWLAGAVVVCFGAAAAISRHIDRHLNSCSEEAIRLHSQFLSRVQRTEAETGIERHWRRRKEGWL